MAKKIGTPCPFKEKGTNPSVFINLTSLPKTSREEDIFIQNKIVIYKPKVHYIKLITWIII